jgi:hypothetical protein
MAMSKPIIPFRIHYLNVKPSDALSVAVEHGLSKLAPFRDRVARCDLHVGRWIQHHYAGSSFRATLEIEPQPGALPLSVECESKPDEAHPALLRLVHDAFARAAMRLAARSQHAAELPVSQQRLEARRLHPLHGLASGELPPGADEW